MTSLRFLGDLHPAWGLLIAFFLGGLAWWIYRREVFDLPNPYSWILPTLRALAIGLAILMLIGPTLHRREVEGELGQLQVLIDASGSMSIQDRGVSDGNRSRFQRAVELLTQGESPILEKLAESHEVQVSRFADTTTGIWGASLKSEFELPMDWTSWKPSQWLGPTRLGDAISRRKAGFDQSDPATMVDKGEDVNGRPQEGLLLILTDGRSNDGRSPLEAAAASKDSKRPIFVIGMGSAQEPPDLAILSFEHPPQVKAKDNLRGRIVMKDRAPQGGRYRVWIESEEKNVWEETLVSQDVDRRVVEFSIPVETLIPPQESEAIRAKLNAIPIALTAHVESLDRSIDPQTGETWESNPANNELKSSLQVLKRKNRVLLMDGRSRWEMRYLRNALERDPSWTLDAFLMEDSNPRSFLSSGESKKFPSEIDEWMEYDLVILGEVGAGAWTPSMAEGLRQLVENGGGGLIMIDGDRGYLHDPQVNGVSSLVPVRKLNAIRNDVRWKGTPTSLARTQNTFQLDDRGVPENDQAWNELPELTKVIPSELQAGAEELLSVKSGEESLPLLVTRLSGAGRVVFCCSDETWRWRYNVADTIHQRFWNQLCRWVMRSPFAMEGEFLSLDTGLLEYRPGDPITIRARLRDRDGKPIEPDLVQAKIESNSSTGTQNVMTLPLHTDAAGASIYRTVMSDLPVGDYKVTIEASGFQAEALALESNFAVKAPPDIESHLLSCDEGLLKQIAETSSGTYLPESRASELLELLKPYQRGRIVESDLLLWQSYYWFLPIIVLLATEWWLRKRAGLI